MIRRFFESIKTFAYFLVPAALTVAVVGYFVLRNPNNPLVRRMEGKISTTDGRIMRGPYPVEKDLILLKHNGVTTLVNLMSPALPYEKPLIEKEKLLAKKYGLEFYNFPMNPVSAMMNRKGSSKNEERANAAMEAIRNSKGKVYYHCYLGIHRVGILSRMLEKEGVKSGEYLVRRGDRATRAQHLDTAQADFDAGDFEKVVAALSKIKNADMRESTLLAWAYYKLEKFDLAKTEFEKIIAADPASADAHNGRGYALLRQGDAKTAGEDFEAALKIEPEDAAALTGSGIALYRQGKPAEAAKALEHALRIQPDNSDAKEALGSIPDKYKSH